MGEGMADCESAAVPTDKLQPAIPGQPRITRRRPQSIQQVVQSGARLTVVHCPRGSVLTSVSEAPKKRSRSAGRPHDTKVRTVNERRAHQPSARPDRGESDVELSRAVELSS